MPGRHVRLRATCAVHEQGVRRASAKGRSAAPLRPGAGQDSPSPKTNRARAAAGETRTAWRRHNRFGSCRKIIPSRAPIDLVPGIVIVSRGDPPGGDAVYKIPAQLAERRRPARRARHRHQHYGDSALNSASSAMRSPLDTITIPGTKSIGARLGIIFLHEPNRLCRRHAVLDSPAAARALFVFGEGESCPAPSRSGAALLAFALARRSSRWSTAQLPRRRICRPAIRPSRA